MSGIAPAPTGMIGYGLQCLRPQERCFQKNGPKLMAAVWLLSLAAAIEAATGAALIIFPSSRSQSAAGRGSCRGRNCCCAGSGHSVALIRTAVLDEPTGCQQASPLTRQRPLNRWKTPSGQRAGPRPQSRRQPRLRKTLKIPLRLTGPYRIRSRSGGRRGCTRYSTGPPELAQFCRWHKRTRDTD